MSQPMKGRAAEEARNMQALALLAVLTLVPGLLLGWRSPSLMSLCLVTACAVAQLLLATRERSRAPPSASAEGVEEMLDKAMAMADGTDGKWHSEGQEGSTEIFSKDMETRFPAFLGKVQESGEALRGRSPDSIAPTAEEALAICMSFLGRQLSDPYRASDTLVERLAPGSWLSYQTWSGNYVQSPQANLYLQAVRRTSTAHGPRFTCVTVPAPTALARGHHETVQRLSEGKSFQAAPLQFSMVDIKSLADGGICVSNVLHVDPSVPRFIPSSMVQSFIKSGVCRGAVFLEMAMKLTLPEPVNVEGPDSRETLAEVTIAGQQCQVSRLLAEVLAPEKSLH